ncbi:hypothetical protein C8R42DRAFT_655244 [Lentinula raphanica]|nr:hypothetical protein C8R42DRAFT_655244 [Lentinula raphanica]
MNLSDRESTEVNGGQGGVSEREKGRLLCNVREHRIRSYFRTTVPTCSNQRCFSAGRFSRYMRPEKVSTNAISLLCYRRGVLLAKTQPSTSSILSLSLSPRLETLPKLEMLVTSLLNYLLPSSLLFGALTMAAPLNPLDIQGASLLTPRKIGSSLKPSASWNKLNVRLIGSKVGDSVLRISEQEQEHQVKSATKKIITVVLPLLVRNPTSNPVGIAGWEGKVAVREHEGKLAQDMLVALPAMPFAGCPNSDTHKLSVQWQEGKADNTVSGSLTLADGRIFEVTDNEVSFVDLPLPPIEERRSSEEREESGSNGPKPGVRRSREV